MDVSHTENDFTIDPKEPEEAYLVQIIESEDGSHYIDPNHPQGNYIMKIIEEEGSSIESDQVGIVYKSRQAEADEYNNRPFECDFCAKRFNRSAHLKSHLLVHTGERRYECFECGDRFKQGSSLKSHMLIHLGERPYVCRWCGKAFRTSSTLKKHTYLHTGEKPYVCEYCEKSFNQLGALKTHRFTHFPEEERPYRCDICDRGFSSKAVQQYHTKHNCLTRDPNRTRTGREYKRNRNPIDESLFTVRGKEFECGFCEKLFKCKGRLKIHLRKHTGERPYVCQICDRAFAQNNDLKVHIYVHTGERPHKCHLCEKGYTNKGTLNQHLRKFHKIKDEEKNRPITKVVVVKRGDDKKKRVIELPVTPAKAKPDSVRPKLNRALLKHQLMMWRRGEYKVEPIVKLSLTKPQDTSEETKPKAKNNANAATKVTGPSVVSKVKDEDDVKIDYECSDDEVEILDEDDSIGYENDSIGYEDDSVGYEDDSVGYENDSVGYENDSVSYENVVADEVVVECESYVDYDIEQKIKQEVSS